MAVTVKGETEVSAIFFFFFFAFKGSIRVRGKKKQRAAALFCGGLTQRRAYSDYEKKKKCEAVRKSKHMENRGVKVEKMWR